MKYSSLVLNNPKTKILLWPLLFFTLPILVYSIYSAFPFSISNFVLFGSAALVATIISEFQLRLPKTSLPLPISNLFAFWAMFWLGPSGGILIGACGAAVNHLYRRDEKGRAVFAVGSEIVAMACAAFALFTVFGEAAIAAVTADGLELNAIKVIVFGTPLIAGVHFLVNSSLLLGFDWLENNFSFVQQIEKQFIRPAAGSSVVAIAAILILNLFARFGIEFGLVIAPVAILANLAYRIHVNRLEQKTKEITDASRIHLATVEALATAIDARDQVGLGHIRRTQIFAVGLGESMGLTKGEINALRTGALLHDIGKLAVPDHILNKPGGLTTGEFEKTKIHSAVGASILEKVGYGYPVAPTVKYHHERWDGAGYPEHLKGEDIPLTARILSIADAYDTLRSARPYRPAIKRDQAIGIIQDEAGILFDPTVVRVFLKNLEMFELEVEQQGLSYEVDHIFDSANAADDDYGFIEQIKLANREVFTLYELAREFTSSVDLEEILCLFAKKVGEFVPFKTCAVYLLDEERQYATAMHVEGANSVELTSQRVKVGQGATGYVLKTGEKVLNADPDIDFSVSHVELTQQYSTMACLPLIEDDEMIGAVSIYSREISKYGEENIRLLETISQIAAEAIGKSLKHDEAKAHAMTDPMTGLPNARSLRIEFEKEMARASRGGTSFKLLMLDLDGFKAVNDSFGHKTGDEFLKEVSKVIRGQLRDYDFLARYGGDEFVALVPDTTAQAVIDLCTRIEHAVGEFSLKIDEDRFATVGVSLGASGYPKDGESFDQMIVAADKAMYERKTRRKRVASVKASANWPWANRDELSLDYNEKVTEDGFIVELDESHVISKAIN